MKSDKLLSLAVACTLACSTMSPARAEERPELSVAEARVPASPAFTLLGVSPSQVESPGNLKDLTFSILSSTERSKGDMPQNLSLEFQPYWWVDHGALSINRYEETAGPLTSPLRTLCFSVATTESETMKGTNTVEGTRLGFGLRFLVLEGELSEDANAKYDKAVKSLAHGERHDPGEPYELAGKVKEVVDAFRKADLQREGWVLEVACALSCDFVENKTDNCEMDKAAVWVTPSYRSKAGTLVDQLTFVGVGRYISDDTKDQREDLFDLGGRVIWTSEKIPISLSGEYVRRFVDQGHDTKNIVAILEYQINDSYSLIASFGKTFDDSFEGKEDLVALFGINFGFGKGPVVTQ